MLQINLEDFEKLIEVAYKGIVQHYASEPGMTGVKLITKANNHVLETCMSCLEKIQSDKTL